MPYYPQADNDKGHQYSVSTWFKKLVSKYTGLNFLEVGELDYLRFLQWRRDAYIYELSRTEAGQEYLDNAWRMEQTKPDRIGLRRKLGKEEEHGEHD